MNIEELAFKNWYELINIQKIDLLLIIEFLQKDRKQWINQFTQTHNESIDIQRENQELKEQNKKEFADYIKFKKEQHDEYLEKVNKLIKEKQELKKQLENNLKINVADHKYASECEDKVIVLETQQKEFIKYLEDEIYSIESKGTGINYNCEYDSEEDYLNAMKEQSRLNTLKEILQKYKETIGDDK